MLDVVSLVLVHSEISFIVNVHCPRNTTVGSLSLLSVALFSSLELLHHFLRVVFHKGREHGKRNFCTVVYCSVVVEQFQGWVFYIQLDSVCYQPLLQLHQIRFQSSKPIDVPRSKTANLRFGQYSLDVLNHLEVFRVGFSSGCASGYQILDFICRIS